MRKDKTEELTKILVANIKTATKKQK